MTAFLKLQSSGPVAIALKACFTLQFIAENQKPLASEISVTSGLEVGFGFIHRGQKLGSRPFTLFP